jgi:hypothetical protein
MSVSQSIQILRQSVHLAVAVCSFVCLTTVRPAVAQDPTAKPDISFKSKRNAISQMLREQNFETGGGQQLFDDYFNTYALLELFPAKLPAEKAHYIKARKELKNYFAASKGGPPHARLNELTLDMMKAAIASNDAKIDLSAKINAMLVIGELNEAEGKPATGLPAALDYLLEFVGQKAPAGDGPSGEFDALRVAALVGIERLSSGVETNPLPADVQAKVRSAMLKIVAAPLPKGPSRPGYDWLRGNAAEVLGALKEVGQNNAVVTALDKGLVDPDSRLRARGQMAEALGQLKYPAESKIDFSALAGHMGQLAVDACTAQAAKAQKDKQAVSRRQLKTLLKNVARGLNGPSERNPGGLVAAASAAHKASVAKVNANVMRLLKQCDDSEDDSLIADLETPLADLRASLAEVLPNKTAKTAVAKKGEAAAAQKSRPGPGTPPARVEESAVAR